MIQTIPRRSDWERSRDWQVNNEWDRPVYYEKNIPPLMSMFVPVI